jgi:hypothetical protein
MNTSLTCSFCGYRGGNGRKLMAGLTAHICDECLASAPSTRKAKRRKLPAECSFCGELRIPSKIEHDVSICVDCVQRYGHEKGRGTAGTADEQAMASAQPTRSLAPQDFQCLPAEQYGAELRTQVLARLREAFDLGYRDPELLYLGGRYAASLGLTGEMRKFVEPLTKMLDGGEQVCEACAPVGLVQLGALPLGSEREQLSAKLQGFSDRLGITDALAGLDTAAPANGHANLGSMRGLLEVTTPRLAECDALKPLLEHGTAASTAYLEDRSGDARAALEALLRYDGDQLEVLRNLVTLASEQRDAEAYERYWRRYVHTLLRRILTGDDVDFAWAELTRFYLSVAVATDRDCKAAPNELAKLLPRPGFLPRWLEAHAALVWLDTARRPRAAARTGLDRKEIDSGRQGYRALLDYWLRVYYPQFLPYLDQIKAPTSPDLPPPGAHAFTLPFDPAERLARRCIEWAELQFLLQGKREGAHAEAVRALAGLVARLPEQASFLRLGKDLGEDIMRGRSPMQALREATSLPLNIGLQDYLDPEEKREDWQGVVAYLGDPDLNIAPSLRLFAAFGMARTKRERDGLELACALLPELDAKQLAEDAQEAGLWKGILVANVNQAGDLSDQGKVATEMANIRALVAATPDLPHIRAYREARLDELDGMLGQLTVKPILEKLGRLRRQSLGADEEQPKKGPKLGFDQIESDLARMPEAPASVKETKQKLRELLRLERAVSTAREALAAEEPQTARMHEVIRRYCSSLPKPLLKAAEFFGRQQVFANGATRAMDAYVAFRRGDYEPYRNLTKERTFRGDSVVNALRDLEPVHKEWRLTLAKWRMAEVAKLDMPQVLLDTAVDESQFLTHAEEFDNAIAILKLLPDQPDQLAEVKRHLLGQVTQAATIGAWRKHIGQGDFAAAKKIADGLPESTPEEKQLKQQLAEATASQKYAAEYKPVVEKTMAEVQSLAQAGKFDQARSKLNSLRGDRPDLVELKRNVLGQLDEAEAKSREVRFVNDTMEEIQRLVAGHRVDEARALADRLPYEVRGKVLPQLDQAEAHQQMEGIVAKLKDLLGKDRFKEARRLVDDLPVHLSPDLAEVQQNLRRQVDEAETGKKLKGQVDSAIKEIQGHVSAGRFRDAERVIDRMPSEVSDLKQNLREQVSQAREQKELSGVVESAVAEIRKHVAAGDFYDARRAVDNLPYNSALDELKKKLRDQIDEAERDYRKMESEIDDLRRRVSRKLDARGIELDELARQNHVDLSIKPQLHGFLKAIDRQL